MVGKVRVTLSDASAFTRNPTTSQCGLRNGIHWEMGQVPKPRAVRKEKPLLPSTRHPSERCLEASMAGHTVLALIVPPVMRSWVCVQPSQPPNTHSHTHTHTHTHAHTGERSPWIPNCPPSMQSRETSEGRIESSARCTTNVYRPCSQKCLPRLLYKLWPSGFP